MSKYLVTGGAGFIGTNLITRLLKDKHKVTSFDNYSTGFADNEVDGCGYYDVDIRKSFDDLKELLTKILDNSVVLRLKRENMLKNDNENNLIKIEKEIEQLI